VASEKYHVEISDARGVLIGNHTVVHQYFLDEQGQLRRPFGVPFQAPPLPPHFVLRPDVLADLQAVEPILAAPDDAEAVLGTCRATPRRRPLVALSARTLTNE